MIKINIYYTTVKLIFQAFLLFSGIGDEDENGEEQNGKENQTTLFKLFLRTIINFKEFYNA